MHSYRKSLWISVEKYSKFWCIYKFIFNMIVGFFKIYFFPCCLIKFWKSLILAKVLRQYFIDIFVWMFEHPDIPLQLSPTRTPSSRRREQRTMQKWWLSTPQPPSEFSVLQGTLLVFGLHLKLMSKICKFLNCVTELPSPQKPKQKQRLKFS